MLDIGTAGHLPEHAETLPCPSDFPTPMPCRRGALRALRELPVQGTFCEHPAIDPIRAGGPFETS